MDLGVDGEGGLVDRPVALDHGAVVVGIPFTEPVLNTTTSGGTPYGASHVSGTDGQRVMSEDEKALARAVAEIQRQAHVGVLFDDVGCPRRGLDGDHRRPRDAGDERVEHRPAAVGDSPGADLRVDDVGTRREPGVDRARVRDLAREVERHLPRDDESCFRAGCRRGSANRGSP